MVKNFHWQTLHPVTCILIWLALALVLPMLKVNGLLACATILLLAIMRLRSKKILLLLRRTRWILLTLLLVYAYATPGEFIWAALGDFSPTQEGLADGLMQISRLVCSLAALSILLTVLPQSRFVAGLYELAYPLRWLGISSERIAVRLALTLEYAETAMRETADDWRSSIEHALARPVDRAGQIELQVQPFSWRDCAVLAVCVTVLVGVWQ